MRFFPCCKKYQIKDHCSKSGKKQNSQDIFRTSENYYKILKKNLKTKLHIKRKYKHFNFYNKLGTTDAIQVVSRELFNEYEEFTMSLVVNYVSCCSASIDDGSEIILK